MKKNHRFYQILVGVTALSLAGVAAYFSVFGLSKLFVATFTILLFAILELGKVVAVTYLHTYWKSTHWLKKSYMLLGVIVMMTITSVGIYGYLSAAYDGTKSKLDVSNKEIVLYENKKEIFFKQIEGIENQISYKDKRLTQLTELRTQQETRLDSLIANNHWHNVKKTREDINIANEDIKDLDSSIVAYNQDIVALNDSINRYDILIIEKGNNEHSADLGPLKHLANAFNVDMDTVVNWLIFAIIFIFDPMAIALLLAFNDITIRRRREKYPTEEDPKFPETTEEPEVEPEIVEEPEIESEIVEELENKVKNLDGMEKGNPVVEKPNEDTSLKELKLELSNIRKEFYEELQNIEFVDNTELYEKIKSDLDNTKENIKNFNESINEMKSLSEENKEELEEKINEITKDIEEFKEDLEERLQDKLLDFQENVQDKLDEFWVSEDVPKKKKKIVFKTQNPKS